MVFRSYYLFTNDANRFHRLCITMGTNEFLGSNRDYQPCISNPICGTCYCRVGLGGFSVDNATLNRFFSLHYLMPFVIAGLVITHLVLLHQTGNNNPIGVDTTTDKMPFYPYCYVKDLLVFFCFSVFFSVMVFFYPNVLGHSDNYIPANPLVTPAHIVPEWYFLPFYAILRSIPDKLGGVVAMGGAILIMLTIPFTNSSEIRSAAFRPLYKKIFWLFVADCLILGWIGQNVVETPFIEIGQLATVFYFAYF